jgi:sRNA-binding regulator protein Hfq
MRAQDTIYCANGDVLVGELKSLDKGVITIETDYSNSDFKIDWDQVSKIHSGTVFIVTLSDGTRLNGAIRTEDSVVVVVTDEGPDFPTTINDIVYLKSVNDGFWSRCYANIDIGLSITKANNLQQLNSNVGFGYLAEKWSVDLRANTLYSQQDSVAGTRRSDGGVNFNFYLPKDWFVVVGVNYLSNTEQKLDLRLNGQLGLGYYVVHKNTWYWSFTGGAAFVDEQYDESVNNKNSMEAFIGTELNLFNLGDLTLYNQILTYPGITQRGRFRTDYKLDIKYDLPYDFYVKGGLNLNYDNQPVAGASELDYVYTTGVGWSW